MKSIAWSNAHAVETYSSKGVSNIISPEHMQAIQKIAFEEGLANLDNFVECFSPQVILYLYRSNSDSESWKFVEGAAYVRSWGKDDMLLEYNNKGVVILHSRHPSWMSKGNVSRETFASTLRETLSSHKLFKVLPCTTWYHDLSEDSDDFKRFSKLLNQIAKKSPTTDNQSLTHELILVVARELQKEQHSTMTARLLVMLLNSVQQFVDSKWIYSPKGRGPGSVVRGTWRDLQNSGRGDDAESVAMAFTSISGDYCYE